MLTLFSCAFDFEDERTSCVRVTLVSETRRLEGASHASLFLVLMLLQSRNGNYDCTFFIIIFKINKKFLPHQPPFHNPPSCAPPICCLDTIPPRQYHPRSTQSCTTDSVLSPRIHSQSPGIHSASIRYPEQMRSTTHRAHTSKSSPSVQTPCTTHRPSATIHAASRPGRRGPCLEEGSPGQKADRSGAAPARRARDSRQRAPRHHGVRRVVLAASLPGHPRSWRAERGGGSEVGRAPPRGRRGLARRGWR